MPPPSTILGLLYSLIQRINPKPNEINLSIQGKHSSLLRDYQWYKKHDSDKAYPILVHALYDVYLLIHIYCSNKEIEDKIGNALINPPYFPYLGRAEDLIKIESVKPVQNILTSKEYDTLKLDAYLPVKLADKIFLDGVLYRLSGYQKFVEISVEQKKKVIRDFDWIDLMYVESGSSYEVEVDEPLITMDNDGDYIWWCMQNPIP